TSFHKIIPFILEFKYEKNVNKFRNKRGIYFLQRNSRKSLVKTNIEWYYIKVVKTLRTTYYAGVV
ncbi:hypothetical protein AOT49_06365, partial [Listeria monocytogenes]|nr:hypothetical protein [Listeria monocytogenes]